jgi:hypothetical protein
VEAGESRVQGHSRLHYEIVSKKRKIRAGGVVQVVEFLPSKLETLTSNPSTRIWYLNSAPYACWASILPLEPHLQPFFALVYFSDCASTLGQPRTTISPTFIAGMIGRHCHPSLFFAQAGLEL